MVMHTWHVRVQHASVLLGIGKVDGTVDLEGSDLDWSLAFDDLARRVDQHQVVCRHLRPEKAVPIDEEPVGASRQQGGQVVTNAFVEPPSCGTGGTRLPGLHARPPSLQGPSSLPPPLE